MRPHPNFEAPRRSLPDRIFIGLLAAGLLVNTSVGLANTMSHESKSDIQSSNKGQSSNPENTCTDQNRLFTDPEGMFVLSSEAGKVTAKCVSRP
jgi:hypothetical protein